MPIRRRLSRRKKIPYHREFGSLSKPPLRDGHWPNGAEVICLQGRKTLLVGFVLRRADYMRGAEYGVSSATEALALDKALTGKTESVVESSLAHYCGQPSQHGAWVVAKPVERLHYPEQTWKVRITAYAPIQRPRGYVLRTWHNDFSVLNDIIYLGEFPSKKEAHAAVVEAYEEKFDTVL